MTHVFCMIALFQVLYTLVNLYDSMFVASVTRLIV